MEFLDSIGIRASNLKCFGDDPQGIDPIAPINIIIGRNNTGKTSLLDMIDFGRTAIIENDLYRRPQEPEVLIQIEITEAVCTHLTRHRPDDPGYIHTVTSLFRSKRAVWRLRPSGKPVVATDLGTTPPPQNKPIAVVYDDLLRRVYEPFTEMASIRIAADRDIVPEIDEYFSQPIAEQLLKPSGDGATIVLARMLLRNNHQHRRIILDKVLRDLNIIYERDGQFEEIRAVHAIDQKTGRNLGDRS